MGMVTLLKSANEGGTYVIQVKPKDEDQNDVMLNSLQWTLTDLNGDIVNNNKDINVEETDLDYVINIVLTDKDLTPGYKILTLKGTYHSVYGTNLPITAAVKFYVSDLLEGDV